MGISTMDMAHHHAEQAGQAWRVCYENLRMTIFALKSEIRRRKRCGADYSNVESALNFAYDMRNNISDARFIDRYPELGLDSIVGIADRDWFAADARDAGKRGV